MITSQENVLWSFNLNDSLLLKVVNKLFAWYLCEIYRLANSLNPTGEEEKKEKKTVVDIEI